MEMRVENYNQICTNKIIYNFMGFAFLWKWQRPMKAEGRLTEFCC